MYSSGNTISGAEGRSGGGTAGEGAKGNSSDDKSSLPDADDNSGSRRAFPLTSTSACAHSACLDASCARDNRYIRNEARSRLSLIVHSLTVGVVAQERRLLLLWSVVCKCIDNIVKRYK